VTIGPETVVVLTGAAHGIGAALVSELNRRNAVLALLDVDADGLENIRSGLQRCSPHVCDVSDVAAVEAAAQTITTQHARVDLLI
jgi:NADP-dependent 3-hydroxy acid dehydrogenase YdfG